MVETKFAEIAAAISRFEEVRINAPERDHARIRRACEEAKVVPERLALFNHPNDDVWCRDHGPLFVRNPETHEIAITDWEFNAWGGKFAPWDSDNRIPQLVAESLGIRTFKPDMVLEGGAIEINGCGQLITTEAVLLNANRNPDLDREAIEERLRQFLGVHDVLWLRAGIEGDDTDGHVDDLVRFVDDETLVASTSTRSPDREVLNENRERLERFRTPSDRAFSIAGLPLPDPCEIPGWRLPVLPASYVNFLVLNGGVLVPTFRQPRGDDRALGLLRELFPDRKVVGIDCLDLVEEGGALHCISQQQPA